MNREELAHAVQLDSSIDAMLRGEDPAGGIELVAARSLVVLGETLPVSSRGPEIRREILTAFPQHRRPWRWLVLAPAAATLAFSGVATASRNAVPGDALYPLRRGMQAVRVAVAFGNDAKAAALLDRAERDLVDAHAFLLRDDERGVRHALEVFDADIDGARAAISRTEQPAKDALNDRADRLEREAREIRDRIDDDRSGGGGGEDRSGSGSGEDSGDDHSGSGSSGSGGDDGGGDDGGGDDGGGDDSGSDSSGPGSGADDGESSGSGGDDGESSEPEGGGDHSGSGSDDRSGSGSDD